MSTNDNIVSLFPPKPEKPAFDYDSGCTQLVCNCGCETLRAYRQDGWNYLECTECGTDQTETYFGDH